MKLRIGDTDYDYMRALNKSKLSDLYDLKVATGVGPRSIYKMLAHLGEAETNDDLQDILEEADVLLATAGLVFLCKRHAGERCTYDESQVSPGDITYLVEESDIPDAIDPQEASGDQSQPDADTVNGQPSKPKTKPAAKSKTSKGRSTTTS